MPSKQKLQDEQLHWYKDAIIYELHIKAFCDGNGDGIGDFEGLISKLDHLQELGVTAVWVLPFYPSPLRDDGYDIADYYKINPSYGTTRQFEKFLNEAHARNLKVITELVINHTSDQHPWFQRARKAKAGSDERNFYVWTDDPNKYSDVRIIFQDFETSNWTWDPIAEQYYWHRFFHHQPDLNYDNPLVQEEIFKVLDYWCGMGVDGFRLDAVPYLFEREGTNGENLPETHAFLKKLRKHVDKFYPGTLLLAEANMWPEDSASYFGDGDECHMNYHFPVMPRIFMAMQMEDRYPITDIFEQTPAIPDTCQWAIFLRNHDELTLEMVTDEERDYMYKVYVKDPKARINLGIRHRLAPLMDNNRKKIELLNYLLFSLPGTPVIYYGDEIGMGDNFYLGDRDGVRTPMQWSGGKNAGFSDANPQQLYLPLILDPGYHYEAVNVERQSHHTSSLLWWTKRVLNIRKKHRAFGRGDMKFINSDNAKILSFTRTYENETILVIVNLSHYLQPVELELSAHSGYIPFELFSKNKFPAIKKNQPYFLSLGPYDCQWFLLNSEEPASAVKSTTPVKISSWDALLTNKHTVEVIENNILPAYLLNVRWFGGKSRIIQHARIAEHMVMPAGDNKIYVVLLEITYQSGLPEIYQLALSYAKKQQSNKLRENYPAAILCDLEIEGKEFVLYDAVFDPAYQQEIFKRMAASAKIHHKDTMLAFHGNKILKKYASAHARARTRISGAEQSNTSLVYDDRFYMKFYRKIDAGVNPDPELNHFLSSAGFENIPPFTGTIEWKHEKGSMTLGMMQEMVKNKGDAWSYMLDKLKPFYESILSKDKKVGKASKPKGTLIKPLAYEEVNDDMKALLGGDVAEQARMLGVRTAQMHLALASDKHSPDFKPEPFSLHYQRSLYSSFQSLIRANFDGQTHNLLKLDEETKAEATKVLGMKEEIQRELKKIYRRKLDVSKMRTHGDYHLGQVLITGKDLVILDFEGEPARSFSERRLKRSPLRDVAGMIRSFHYAAYSGLFLDEEIRKRDLPALLSYAAQWYHYMSGFFMKAYLETVKGSNFVPADEEDLEILLNSYLLEKAIYELGYELNNRPQWVIIPLRGILAIMDNINTK